jgi:methyl-accepting chemotaxis protein
MLNRAFKNTAIRSKVLLLVAIPLVFLTALAGSQIVTLAKQAQFDTKLTQDVMLTVGDLVHEVQVERGMTASFLASEARDIPTELTKQRELVDTKSVHMQEIFDMIDLNSLHGTSVEFVEAAHHELEAVHAIRAQVDERSLPLAEAVAFFTALNTHLLETALALEILIPDTVLAERSMALTYFQLAKDAYGLQRAAGAIGFSEGWTTANIVRLAVSTDQAKERLRVFHEMTTSASYGLYEEHVNSDIYRDFQSVRDAVLHGDALPPITPEDWFDLATRKIVGIKKVEEQIVANLSADYTAFHTNNRNALVTASIGFVSLMVVILYISAQLISDMVGGLRKLTEALEEIGQNNLEQAVPGQTRKDEIGRIAREAETLRGHAIEKRTADAELSQNAKEQAFVQNQIGIGLAQLQNKAMTFRITEYFPDRFKSLRQDFNLLAQELDGALQLVRETGLSVSESAMSISAAAGDLSNRTESQAAALERSTSALREITDSVRTSAIHASEAETLSSQSLKEVEVCSEIVIETTDAMTAIETSSAEISQIAKVIEGIAFQTNLLALNAGVEAARAGEAGRGFSVVAGEVQSLAQRTTDAVAQIEELTSRSAGEVKRGSKLANSAGDAMNKVSGQVREVSELIQSISQAIGNQSSQLTDVNSAIGEMDGMTKNNVAMAEESAAASQSLHGLASQLTVLIAAFKLGEDAAVQRKQQNSAFAA